MPGQKPADYPYYYSCSPGCIAKEISVKRNDNISTANNKPLSQLLPIHMLPQNEEILILMEIR